MISQPSETLTPREREELNWEKESARMQMDYGLQVERLKVEVTRLDTKWTQVFKLPLALIDLPIKLLVALAIPISVITKKELPTAYWDYMK